MNEGVLNVYNLGIPIEGFLTLSLNIRRLSKVCRFCSRSAVPAEYKLTSSSCSTATATQKRALCRGESWPRRHVQVSNMNHKTVSFNTLQYKNKACYPQIIGFFLLLACDSGHVFYSGEGKYMSKLFIYSLYVTRH